MNLASRVQGATKFLKTSLLITGDTASRVKHTFPTRRLSRVRVQNIQTPMDLHEHEVPGIYGDWDRLSSLYENALSAFEGERFDEARAGLTAFLSEVPADGPARLLLKRLTDAERGSSLPFDPVWSLPGK